jgi:hypothetical protein
MEFWPEDDAPDDTWRDGLAVVVARMGVYAYDLGSKLPKSSTWESIANGPISGYAWANMDGKPGLELVVCRQDGFVDVFDRAGKLLRSWPTGSRNFSVCTWNKSGASVTVGTGDAVIFYDAQGNELSRASAPARKLIVLRDGRRQILVAAGDGRTVAFH